MPEPLTTITVDGGADSPRDLLRWLTEQEELRGRAWLIAAPSGPGALGSVLDTISVAVAPGGAGGVLAAALVTWIRHRTGKVRITVRRPDGGQVELTADRVRGLDSGALRATMAEVAAPPPSPDGTT